MAAEIFKTNDLAFASRPRLAFADKLPYGTSSFITAEYGDYWRFMKKLCVTELLGVKQLERSRAVRREELDCFLKKLVESGKNGEAVDVRAEVMKLTNHSTCRVILSARCSEDNDEAERLIEMVTECVELAVKMSFGDVFGPLKRLGFWIYGRKAVELTLRYDEILEKMLKEHEERGKREDKDLMDVLLEVYQDDKAGMKLTRTHIKAFILELFMAGTNTSAESMQWTIAELINHPDVFKKVREEIDLAVGRTRLVEESDIPNLPYLQAVVKETLRLHPPAPVATRECRKNCKIGGFNIPEKTAVAINLYAIMRDPEIWDDPTEFRPERFLVPSKEQVDLDQIKGQNFNFVPFGGGRRGCPGTLLAFAMMNTTVAAIVQCFDWKLGGDGDGGKVDMQSGPGLSLSMLHPLKCHPIVHFNPFEG